jgi:hypothetical protein
MSLDQVAVARQRPDGRDCADTLFSAAGAPMGWLGAARRQGPEVDAKPAELGTAAQARFSWVRRAASSVESAALAGAASAVMLVLSTYLLRLQPGAASSDAELTAWFGDAGNQRLVLIGLNLAPFSAIAFLWFIAVIRRRLGEREDQFFATVFLGSGFAVAFFMVAAAVAAAAPTLVVHYGGLRIPDADILALAHGLWFGLFVIGAARFSAVFMIVTSTVGLRFGALPRWLAVLGYLLALVLFVTGAFSDPLTLVFPVWLVVVSVTLLVRRRLA